MEEKIKKIYSILGIIILILLIIIMGLDIFNLRINLNFFTFNKKECIEMVKKSGVYGKHPKSVYDEYLAETRYEETTGKPLPSKISSNLSCSRPSLFIRK